MPPGWRYGAIAVPEGRVERNGAAAENGLNRKRHQKKKDDEINRRSFLKLKN
jgi:hypothetical protein